MVVVALKPINTTQLSCGDVTFSGKVNDTLAQLSGGKLDVNSGFWQIFMEVLLQFPTIMYAYRSMTETEMRYIYQIDRERSP